MEKRLGCEQPLRRGGPADLGESFQHPEQERGRSLPREQPQCGFACLLGEAQFQQQRRIRTVALEGPEAGLDGLPQLLMPALLCFQQRLAASKSPPGFGTQRDVGCLQVR